MAQGPFHFITVPRITHPISGLLHPLCQTLGHLLDESVLSKCDDLIQFLVSRQGFDPTDSAVHKNEDAFLCAKHL